MNSMRSTRHTRPAGRLLALLAVLLGLLALHGLVSDHHAAAAAPVLGGARGSTSSAAQHAAPAHEHPAAAWTAGGATVVGQVPTPPHCDADCPGSIAKLCVAVLVAAATASLLARRPIRGALPDRAHLQARAPTPRRT